MEGWAAWANITCNALKNMNKKYDNRFRYRSSKFGEGIYWLYYKLGETEKDVMLVEQERLDWTKCRIAAIDSYKHLITKDQEIQWTDMTKEQSTQILQTAIEKMFDEIIMGMNWEITKDDALLTRESFDSVVSKALKNLYKYDEHFSAVASAFSGNYKVNFDDQEVIEFSEVKGNVQLQCLIPEYNIAPMTVYKAVKHVQSAIVAMYRQICREKEPAVPPGPPLTAWESVNRLITLMQHVIEA